MYRKTDHCTKLKGRAFDLKLVVVADAVGVGDAGGVIVAGNADEVQLYGFDLLFKFVVDLRRFFFADVITSDMVEDPAPLRPQLRMQIL